MKVIPNTFYQAYDTGNENLVMGTTLRCNEFDVALHTAENEIETIQALKSRKMLSDQNCFNFLATLNQIHSEKIVRITEEIIKKGEIECAKIDGDALYTDLKGILLGISTADCVPVIIYDIHGKAIGAAHAGWKGAKARIHLKLAHKMADDFNLIPGDMRFIIGPHIRQCCYEVKEDTASHFNPMIIDQRVYSLYMSLEKAIINDLMEFGIHHEQIVSSNQCTYCDTQTPLYSYRRGHKKGRLLSFIGKLS